MCVQKFVFIVYEWIKKNCIKIIMKITKKNSSIQNEKIIFVESVGIFCNFTFLISFYALHFLCENKRMKGEERWIYIDFHVDAHHDWPLILIDLHLYIAHNFIRERWDEENCYVVRERNFSMSWPRKLPLSMAFYNLIYCIKCNYDFSISLSLNLTYTQ